MIVFTTVGSNKYKGIRKTDGPKARGKKQARKGIRKLGFIEITQEIEDWLVKSFPDGTKVGKKIV